MTVTTKYLISSWNRVFSLKKKNGTRHLINYSQRQRYQHNYISFLFLLDYHTLWYQTMGWHYPQALEARSSRWLLSVLKSMCWPVTFLLQMLWKGPRDGSGGEYEQIESDSITWFLVFPERLVSPEILYLSLYLKYFQVLIHF